ncbi:hypothetical protein ABS71_08075 [bacterium SCN 62-11]|nr:hypothetical protein [Candidatus Eremiobacteraeota bacterium]ODT71735.1 MAG: hypothetical protein ABS71_08075 [bacterium SCN 62-11]
MGQLQQLQQQDPAKFKQFMSDEAAKLKDAASKATGEDAKRLSSLADKFSQAASSGDLSAFQPNRAAGQGGTNASGVQAYQQAQAQGHHHHHHGGGGGGGGAVQQALSSVSSDLASALGSAA